MVNDARHRAYMHTLIHTHTHTHVSIVTLIWSLTILVISELTQSVHTFLSYYCNDQAKLICLY